jgi:hypothetical protein
MEIRRLLAPPPFSFKFYASSRIYSLLMLLSSCVTSIFASLSLLLVLPSRVMNDFLFVLKKKCVFMKKKKTSIPHRFPLHEYSFKTYNTPGTEQLWSMRHNFYQQTIFSVSQEGFGWVRAGGRARNVVSFTQQHVILISTSTFMCGISFLLALVILRFRQIDPSKKFEGPRDLVALLSSYPPSPGNSRLCPSQTPGWMGVQRTFLHHDGVIYNSKCETWFDL